PRVRDFLTRDEPPPVPRRLFPVPSPPVYKLSRDYAGYLKICALTTDAAMRQAAKLNLDRSHYDDLTFA
ncbi:MAG TPA: hypothetical protein VI670_19510, partial [Thermoanaerobaculia bacterium]